MEETLNNNYNKNLLYKLNMYKRLKKNIYFIMLIKLNKIWK